MANIKTPEPISEQDYLARIQRARELMGKSGYDALIIFGYSAIAGNIRYIANYRPFDLSLFTMPGYMPNATILLSREGEPTIFVPTWFIPEAKERGSWMDVQSMEIFEDFIREFRSKNNLKKVGIDGWDTIPVSLWELYTKAFSGVELEKTKIVEELRMIKSDKELAWQELAARITVEGMKTAIENIKEGVTERKIARAAELAMLEMDAEDLSFQTVVMSGPYTEHVVRRPTERCIEPGDLVLLDIGARTRMGYCSDMARTVGYRVLKDKEKLLEIVAEANRRGQEAVKPGVPAGDIDKAVRGYITEMGYGKNFPQSGYHGMGIEFAEHFPPTTLLKPGMVFNVLSAVFITGAGARIENNTLVTQMGRRVLTDYPLYKLL